MSRYEIIELPAGMDVGEAFERLAHYEVRHFGDKHAKVEFNGEWLYSDVDSEDDMYIKITGMTKKEHQDMLDEWRKEIEREERLHKETLPEKEKYYIREGHRILREDKWERWDDFVPVRLRDLYKGFELDSFLELEKMVRAGRPFKEIEEAVYKQGHSGGSWFVTLNTIYLFSSKGKDLYEYLKD